MLIVLKQAHSSELKWCNACLFAGHINVKKKKKDSFKLHEVSRFRLNGD